jgi:hypothetical protein
VQISGNKSQVILWQGARMAGFKPVIGWVLALRARQLQNASNQLTRIVYSPRNNQCRTDESAKNPAEVTFAQQQASQLQRLATAKFDIQE